MRTVRETDRARGAADFLHGDDVREIAHARTAVGLLHGDAEHAQGSHLAPQIHRELIAAIDLARARSDLGGRELPHRVAEHVDGVAEMEVEHGKGLHRWTPQASGLPESRIGVWCMSANGVRLPPAPA